MVSIRVWILALVLTLSAFAVGCEVIVGPGSDGGDATIDGGDGATQTDASCTLDACG